jgi:hypothetical protein
MLGIVASENVWRGTLNYPGCSKSVPLHIEWDKTTQLVKWANWTFETCDGGFCTRKTEANLKVTMAGNRWIAQGDSSLPGDHFYSLEATLQDDNLLNGKLHDLNHHYNRSVTDGTFTATKDGKEANYTCQLPPDQNIWVGTLNYPGCSKNVPVHIEWDKTTQLVKWANWTFETCDGGFCTRKTEANLKSRWPATGGSHKATAPFQATISTRWRQHYRGGA